MPMANTLSVWMSIDVWEWPTYLIVSWIGMASWKFSKSSPVLTYVVDDNKFFMIMERICIAPLCDSTVSYGSGGLLGLALFLPR